MCINAGRTTELNVRTVNTVLCKRPGNLMCSTHTSDFTFIFNAIFHCPIINIRFVPYCMTSDYTYP